MTEKTEIRMIITGTTYGKDWTSSRPELNGMEMAKRSLEKERDRIAAEVENWQPHILSAHLETRTVTEWQSVPESEVVSS